MITTQAREEVPNTSAIMGSDKRQPHLNEAPQGSEAPKEAPTDVKPDPLSPKFAHLARQEKKLRSLAEQLKTREEALNAKETEYQTGYIPKGKLKEAAMEALQKGEISYEEFTNAMLAQPPSQVDPVIQELKAQNEQLKARLDKFEGETQESKTKEYQQAVAQIRHDVKQLTAENPEYELINAMGQHDEVVALIEETFKEDGTIMSITDAAKEIEKYLEAESEKILSLNKIKSKFNPAPTDTVEKQAIKTAQHTQPRTLTNAVQGSKPLSPRERAILALQGKLNG